MTIAPAALHIAAELGGNYRMTGKWTADTLALAVSGFEGQSKLSALNPAVDPKLI